MDAFAGLLSWASEVLPSYVFCCDNSMGSSHTAAKSRRTICNEGDLPRSGTYLPVIKFKQINKRDLFYYVYLDSSLLKKMLGPSERVLASKTPLSSLFRVSCNRMVDWLGSLQGRKGAFPCLKKTTIYIHVGIKKKGDDLEDLWRIRFYWFYWKPPKKVLVSGHWYFSPSRVSTGQLLCLNSRMRGSAGAAWRWRRFVCPRKTCLFWWHQRVSH